MTEAASRTRGQRSIGSRQPVQQRSRQRREEILLTTGTLLERVGFDALTTILIAKELKISVGALYHYFPNKQAILYAMGEHWLEEYNLALDAVSAEELEGLDIPAFSELALSKLLQVYREQKGILPLVQAMCAVPELYEMDEAHDETVVASLTEMLQRLGFTQPRAELQRRCSLWLEMSHALLLSICGQPKARAKRSFADLVMMSSALLEQP